MKKHFSIFLLLVFSMAIFSVCSKSSQAPLNSSESAGSGEEVAWPRTIVDAGGYEITLSEVPQRIAILHSNYLEYFFSLDVPVIASAGASVGTAQQALDTYETLIPYGGSTEIIDLGSAREINLEAILEAEPDIIVTFAGHSGLDEIYAQLNQIAPVILLDFKDTWQNQTLACAEILGKEDEAKELIAQTERAITTAHEILSGQEKTVAIFRTNGGKAFVARGNSDYYDTFGITPPEGYTYGYETFSLEAVAKMDPDYIIFMDYIDIAQGFVKSQETSSVWLNMKAIENGNVFYYDDSLNTFGPLAMKLAAEKLVDTIQ